MKILKLELEIEDGGKKYTAVDFREVKDGEYYLYSDYWKGVAVWSGNLCFHKYIIMKEISDPLI